MPIRHQRISGPLFSTKFVFLSRIYFSAPDPIFCFESIFPILPGPLPSSRFFLPAIPCFPVAYYLQCYQHFVCNDIVLHFHCICDKMTICSWKSSQSAGYGGLDHAPCCPQKNIFTCPGFPVSHSPVFPAPPGEGRQIYPDGKPQTGLWTASERDSCSDAKMPADNRELELPPCHFWAVWGSSGRSNVWKPWLRPIGPIKKDGRPWVPPCCRKWEIFFSMAARIRRITKCCTWEFTWGECRGPGKGYYMAECTTKKVRNMLGMREKQVTGNRSGAAINPFWVYSAKKGQRLLWIKHFISAEPEPPAE